MSLTMSGRVEYAIFLANPACIGSFLVWRRRDCRDEEDVGFRFGVGRLWLLRPKMSRISLKKTTCILFRRDVF